MARLIAAGITAGRILDPAERDPRGPSRRGAPALTVVPAARPLSVPAQPGHPAGAELRLLPLSGFHWGGAGRKGQGPRIRRDHVLLAATDGVTIGFPRREHALPAGQLAFIPAGTAFSLHPPAGTDGQVLLIGPQVFRDHPLPAGFRSGAPDPGDAALVAPALEALASGPAMACRLEFLAAVLSQLRDTPPPAAPPPWRIAEARPASGPASPGQILDGRLLAERFLALARAQLALDRTMAELAGSLGATLAQLDRACRQARGRGALELLYDLRLELALDALRDRDRPVATIAQDLGFSGPGHFMRVFQAATGRTPEAYRLWLRGQAGA